MKATKQDLIQLMNLLISEEKFHSVTFNTYEDINLTTCKLDLIKRIDNNNIEIIYVQIYSDGCFEVYVAKESEANKELIEYAELKLNDILNHK